MESQFVSEQIEVPELKCYLGELANLIEHPEPLGSGEADPRLIS
jgi:hypothetical protein